MKRFLLLLMLTIACTDVCTAARDTYEVASHHAELEGNLHAALLLALILATMAVCRRYGKRPALAVPIVLVALVTGFFAVILLLIIMSLLGWHAFTDDSFTAFLAHQGAILLGCLLALFYALPWKPRLVSLMLLLCVAFLVGWHFNRLIASDWYRSEERSGIFHERVRAGGPHPIPVWHTWLTGLGWVANTHQVLQLVSPPSPRIMRQR